MLVTYLRRYQERLDVSKVALRVRQNTTGAVEARVYFQIIERAYKSSQGCQPSSHANSTIPDQDLDRCMIRTQVSTLEKFNLPTGSSSTEIC